MDTPSDLAAAQSCPRPSDESSQFQPLPRGIFPSRLRLSTGFVLHRLLLGVIFTMARSPCSGGQGWRGAAVEAPPSRGASGLSSPGAVSSRALARWLDRFVKGTCLPLANVVIFSFPRRTHRERGSPENGCNEPCRLSVKGGEGPLGTGAALRGPWACEGRFDRGLPG